MNTSINMDTHDCGDLAFQMHHHQYPYNHQHQRNSQQLKQPPAASRCPATCFSDSTSVTASLSTSQQQQKGSLQLWRFLVTMLDDPASQHLICWTGRRLEFKLNEPEEVARLWGIQKNRPTMNYDKLSRSLRYYYEKGIISKVSGERYVYRFTYEPEVLAKLTLEDTPLPPQPHPHPSSNDVADDDATWRIDEEPPHVPMPDGDPLVVYQEETSALQLPQEMSYQEGYWENPAGSYHPPVMGYDHDDWAGLEQQQPPLYAVQNCQSAYEYGYNYEEPVYCVETLEDNHEATLMTTTAPSYAYFQYPDYF